MLFSCSLQNLFATTYQEILDSERPSSQINKNLNGFLDNSVRFVKDKHCKVVENKGTIVVGKYKINEVESFLGITHNVLVSTLYHCDAAAPKASSFAMAIDGKHTPDSSHYAALISSALELKGIDVDFFAVKNKFYGVRYKENKKHPKQLFWCILTTQTKKGPTTSVKEYVKLFNKYNDFKVNGISKITASDVTFLSKQDFIKKFKTEEKIISSFDSNEVSEDSLSALESMLDKEAATVDDTRSFTQNILAPKENVKESAIDQSYLVKAEPKVGVEAIAMNVKTTEIYNNEDKIYLSSNLRKSIESEILSKQNEIKSCAVGTGLKNSSLILKYNIDSNGLVLDPEYDSAYSDELKSCINTSLNSARINSIDVMFPVKIVQVLQF